MLYELMHSQSPNWIKYHPIMTCLMSRTSEVNKSQVKMRIDEVIICFIDKCSSYIDFRLGELIIQYNTMISFRSQMVIGQIRSQCMCI